MTTDWCHLVPLSDRTPCNEHDPWAVNYRNFWGKPNAPLETLRSRRLAPTGKLHIFSQYDTLYRQICEHREPGPERCRLLPLGWASFPAGPVIVLGTPGIGKSVFVHYYAARLLRDSIAFILYTFEAAGPCFRFFTPDYVWTAPPACLVAIVNAPGNPALNAPFLIDVDFVSGLPSGITRQGSPFFFLQAACPNEDDYYSWSEQLYGKRWLTMNSHPQEEVLQFFISVFPNRRQPQLITAIESSGPDFRSIMDSLTALPIDDHHDDGSC